MIVECSGLGRLSGCFGTETACSRSPEPWHGGHLVRQAVVLPAHGYASHGESWSMALALRPQRLAAPAGAPGWRAPANVVTVAPARTRAKRSRFRGELPQRLAGQRIRPRVRHAVARSKPTIPARGVRCRQDHRARPGVTEERSLEGSEPGRVARWRADCGRPAPDDGPPASRALAAPARPRCSRPGSTAALAGPSPGP
jgi:hypothetical protein